MGDAAAQASWVCSRCGKDCRRAGLRRAKDRKGNIVCEVCVQHLRAAAKSRAATSPAPAPVTLAEDGTIALAPEEAPVAVAMRKCAKCGDFIAATVAQCPYCGFDETAPEPARPKRNAKPRHACTKCGYDMAGLETIRCPECGAVNIPPTKTDLLKEDSKRVVRWAYLRPIIMLACGLAGIVTFTLVQEQPALLGFYFAKYLVGVPIGLGVYIVCCLAWVGFDMPLHLIALRLAAIYAIMDLLWLFVDLIPTGAYMMRLHVFTWAIYGFIYTCLLKEELDLEWVDAWIIAAFTGIAKVMLWIMIAVAVAKALGVNP